MKQTAILFGHPGVGKNVQMKMLQEMVTQRGFLCQTLDIGGHFRDFMQRGGKTGIKKHFLHNMNEGVLLPAAFPITALTEVAVLSLVEWDFFLTTGIGRRVEETKMAVDLLSEIPDNKINAILIDVCEEEAEKRLLERKRPDDKIGVIRRRHAESCVYIQESWRCLQLDYPNVSVFRISGLGTPEEVHKQVAVCLNLSQLPHRKPPLYTKNS